MIREELEKLSSKELSRLLTSKKIPNRSKFTKKAQKIDAILSFTPRTVNEYKNIMISYEQRQKLLKSYLKKDLIEIAKHFKLNDKGTRKDLEERLMEFASRDDDFQDAFDDRFVRIEGPMKGVLTTWRDDALTHKDDYKLFLSAMERDLKQHIQTILKDNMTVKLNTKALVLFQSDSSDISPSFATKSMTFTRGQEIDVSDMLHSIEQRIDTHLQKSGLIFKRFDAFSVDVYKYTPLKGGSYTILPKRFQERRGILNIDNSKRLKNECALLCIAAARHPAKRNVTRLSHYEPYLDEINTNGVSFPLSFKNFKRLETQNDFGLMVYGLENEKNITILYTSGKLETTQQIIKLLYYKEHYCLIKNLNALMNACNKDSNKQGSRFPCEKCLHICCSKAILAEHRKDCFKTSNGRIRMPEKGNDDILKFKNEARKMRVPYVIYADFESSLIEISKYLDSTDNVKEALRKIPFLSCEEKEEIRASSHPGEKYKNIVAQKDSKCLNIHKANSYCYLIVGPPGFKPIERLYIGENAESHFVSSIMDDTEWLVDKIKEQIPMNLSAEEERRFQNATSCHICKTPFKIAGKFSKKVRDHDHYTGQFRGAAHNSCNLNFKAKQAIPVFIHNLKGYDCHLIMQAAANEQFNLKALPKQSEEFVMFQIGKAKFLDSFSFLASSLEKLAESLDKSDFNHTRRMVKNNDELLNLLTQKGVYPYEWVDGLDKLNATQLPPIEAFTSKMSGEISNEDYDFAQHVWKKLKCQTFEDYHRYYLRTDVYLLTDVFERFRDISIASYELDPAHYLTLPGYSWDACLKMTEINLELLTDPDMHMMIESGIRGGPSFIKTKHSKSSMNTECKDSVCECCKQIIYLDANNLYGFCMCKKLPTGGFEWVQNPPANLEYLKELRDENRNKGRIYKVKLTYPDNLHDEHDDYPLAIDRLVPTNDLMSETTVNLQKIQKLKESTQPKLIPNFLVKDEYVVHEDNLIYYLSKGLILEEIYKTLEFNHSDWLKPYIEFNTEKRKQAKTSFEKDFYKLMNNAVYGKTMEDVRNHIEAKVVTSEKSLEYQIKNIRFKSAKVFCDNLAFVELEKKEVVLNKPIYCGFTILDHAKLHMYQFHYDYIKKKYPGNRSKLLFSDTDSLTYQINSKNIYRDLYKDRNVKIFNEHTPLIDFSGLAQGNPYHFNENKKVIGAFSCETDGVEIQEFVGLRSKMYSCLLKSGKNKKTAKGVKKVLLKDGTISHQDYLNCINTQKPMRHKMYSLRNNMHEIYSIESTKISLSSYDDKAFLLEDGINQRSIGHYKNKN